MDGVGYVMDLDNYWVPIIADYINRERYSCNAMLTALIGLLRQL